MENMIKHIKISKLFDDKDIDWQLNKTNVLVGKNGMGKSTILQLVIGAISKTDNFKKSEMCSSIEVILENGDFFVMNQEEMPDRVRDDLVKILQNNPNILKEMLKKDEVASELQQLFNMLKVTSNLPSVTKFSSGYKQEEIELNFEFISTVNLNANANQNIPLGNGEVQNILDLEIKTELQRLLIIQDKELNERLLKSLNEMFNESDKQVRLDNDFELEFKYKEELLYFPQLSSGERQVIYILLKVAIATHNNALILMDEPEISLHLSWQEKLLTQIRTINPDSQIIIVTHSPAIVMNGWLDCFVDIQDIMVKG